MKAEEVHREQRGDDRVLVITKKLTSISQDVPCLLVPLKLLNHQIVWQAAFSVEEKALLLFRHVDECALAFARFLEFDGVGNSKSSADEVWRREDKKLRAAGRGSNRYAPSSDPAREPVK